MVEKLHRWKSAWSSLSILLLFEAIEVRQIFYIGFCMLVRPALRGRHNPQCNDWFYAAVGRTVRQLYFESILIVLLTVKVCERLANF